MPHLHPSAVLLAPEVLVLDPEWLTLPAGIIAPRWLLGHALAVQHGTCLPNLIRHFLGVVRALAPTDHTIGTIGGRVIDDPCEAGHWHTDTGTDHAVRYAVTIHADPAVDCGHEFRGLRGPLPSGHIGVFQRAEHRRPRVARGRRVFLSAATYPTRQQADLTCVLLRELAHTP